MAIVGVPPMDVIAGFLFPESGEPATESFTLFISRCHLLASLEMNPWRSSAFLPNKQKLC